MSKKAVIIDYQLGNLFSVNQALVNIGLEVKVTSDCNDIDNADAIILPGVGAFQDAMDNLNSLNLTQSIKKSVENGKPFLGICLGLQLLFNTSEEFGATEGLGLIAGDVKRFKNTDLTGNQVKVPQIAWNNINMVTQNGWQNTPLNGIQDGEDVYFVHSYYVNPVDKSVILSETQYGGITYASSILKDNIFACQFHPEKSATEGLKIYKNWAIQSDLL